MDLLKNNVAAGVGIAFAATVLAPILIPAMGRIGRPLTKSLVRGGMLMYEKGREAIAVAGESVEDIMAEIRAESAAPTASAQADAAAPAQAASGAAPATPGAPPAAPYSGNGAASGANGASPGGAAPDGAHASEAGSI